MSSTLIDRRIVSSDPGHRHLEVIARFPPDFQGKVLDVGGFIGSSMERQVNPRVQVDSLNKPDEPHGRRATITGDARQMYLDDHSYPVITAVDMIAHVLSHERDTVMRELTRAAGDRVIISTPIRTPDIGITDPYIDRNTLYELDVIRRMQQVGIEPKQAFVDHRWLGLPTLDDIVRWGRGLRVPFEISPSTPVSPLFQSMRDQVSVYRRFPDDDRAIMAAREIAKDAEKMLDESGTPTWHDAYRAIASFYKCRRGEQIVNPYSLHLTRNEVMAYQAAMEAAGWGHILDENIFKAVGHNPLRGRSIVIEGPEGSGKTTLVKALSKRLNEWGYDTVITTDFGLRQSIRDMEKKLSRVILDPERAEFFAFAMIEAAVAANAFSLLGPCKLSVSDRGIESVRMHHGWHCPDNVTIPYLLVEQKPISYPPDLTLILWVENLDQNYYLMQKDGDPGNQTKGKDALQYQRKFYRDLVWNGGSEFTGPIRRIRNPGVEGTFDSVLEEALAVIQECCNIPTTR